MSHSKRFDRSSVGRALAKGRAWVRFPFSLPGVAHHLHDYNYTWYLCTFVKNDHAQARPPMTVFNLLFVFLQLHPPGMKTRIQGKASGDHKFSRTLVVQER